MSTPTTQTGGPAMALAVFFAGVTAYVLFADVIAGGRVTVNHVLTLAALVAALAASHYAWPQLRAGAVVSSGLLCGLAIVSTGYVLVSSTARNAEQQQAKVAGALKAGGDRRRAEAAYRSAADELAGLKGVRSTSAVKAALDAAPIDGGVFLRTKQCTDVTRAASLEACRPVLELRKEMADAIRKAELEHKVDAAKEALDRLGPAPEANGGYAHAAKVLAVLPGVTAAADVIEAQLTLAMPPVVTGLVELATIVFWHLALAQRENLRSQIATSSRKPSPAPQIEPVAADRPGADRSERPRRRPPGGLSRRSGGLSKIEAHADLCTLLALGRSIPAQRELADRWHRPKQTVSDWLSDWERSGVIPTRRKVGREKMLAGA